MVNLWFVLVTFASLTLTAMGVGGPNVEEPFVGGFNVEEPGFGGPNVQEPSVGGSNVQEPGVGGSNVQATGVGGSTVEIVVTDGSSLGGCRSKNLPVEFEELKSTLTGVVYKRVVVLEKEAVCLMGLAAIDEEKHNLKTCLEAAAKAGMNMFALDGETCTATAAPAKKTDETAGTITVYAVEMIGPGEDKSIDFTVTEVQEKSFKISMKDFSPCSTGATYEVEVVGETKEVTGATDGEAIDVVITLAPGEAKLPACEEELEFVLRRFVNEVQIGQAISKKWRTYQELPPNYLDTLTLTTSGTDVVINWDLVECWGLIKDTVVKHEGQQLGDPVVPPDSSFTVTDCSLLDRKFQVITTYYDLNLLETTAESENAVLDTTGLDLGLVLNLARYSNDDKYTEVFFRDESSCGDSVKYKLALSSESYNTYYELDNDYRTAVAPPTDDTEEFTLKRTINDIQIGETTTGFAE